MKYEDCKNMMIDLGSLGGNRLYTLEEIVKEIVCNRRERFFDQLFYAKKKLPKMVFCREAFDAIGFCAATQDFYVHLTDSGYEGEILYDVIAGGDWVWHCKTQITWESALPVVGGYLMYHTEVVPGEKVKTDRVNAMTGTSFSLQVLKDNLKPITFMEAVERDRINLK